MSISIDKSQEKWLLLLPVFIAILYFGVVFDYSILNPQNISWLSGDRLQAYLGWEFYRNTPWSFPVIGRTNYGMELGSSVIFTDSNPWFSIIFKIISPLLSYNFQYSGIWLMLCMILQAIVIWKIISLYTQNNVIRILTLVFMLFNPAWIARSGHLTLMAFFTFTYAIYLTLRYTRYHEYKFTHWCLLLCLAVGIHFYLFLISGLNWMMLLIYMYWKDEDNRSYIIKSTIITFIAFFIVTYVLGYYTVGEGGIADGFGYYKANLLTPIVAGDFSHIIGLNNFHTGEYEGYNYFGLGLLLLIVINLIFGKLDIYSSIRRNFALFAFLVTCFFIALSNIPAIGENEFLIPLPDFILKICSVFRASGRFFWPITLVIYIYFISKTLTWSKTKNYAIFILAICSLLQVVDTSNGWLNNHRKLTVDTKIDPEIEAYQDFWGKNLQQYKNIRWYPLENPVSKWKAASYLANQYKQNTSAVYFARVNIYKALQVNKEVLDSFIKGTYASDTAYLMDKNYSSVIKIRPGDLYIKYKDLYMLLPGKVQCFECENLNKKTNTLLNENVIEFNSNTISSIYTLDGWSRPESWGIWTSGNTARLSLPASHKMTISFNAFVVPNLHDSVKITFSCNNTNLGKFETTSFYGNNVSLDTSSCQKDHKGYIQLQIHVANPVSPQQLSMSNDNRVLGIGLTKIEMFNK
ncbi:hypothetical protein EGT71_02275 [Atlantibacter subterranea]|uniref:Glycosyltransferase RgtA/B/C/D-like domain-containing protein n=1 Tax=Atlantibacter subterraneus TaxID=255519 RepID=A0A3R9GX74_9ENTR|nr:DUF6311 domain-containing protein [Atlantibacter subterranea]MDA3133962.1 DUF6311 domain-containing protein [Atlantibacter subterranea]RSB64551.1 hypothetical protein EGK67_05075 [Atlantibacter subterranea]RSE07660.1 hypothetical protein EGT84_03710 [Atlantibacter subterranea]RSE29355.1 hypothetical protein EGT71_02275 [Atlantibacter subterranea]